MTIRQCFYIGGRLPPYRSGKGVMPFLSIYEVFMVLFSFGTFLIALLALVIKMTNKK
ncbi:MAG: putative holin-like toxin [Halobacillus sp.]